MSTSSFWHLARLRASERHLPAWRQLAEAATLRVLYGIGPSYYQLAGFWQRDVTWHDKIRHMSVTAYRKRLAQLNPLNYRKLSQNKLAEKAILETLRIPTPEYLGYYHPGAGKTRDGMPLIDASSLGTYLGSRPDLSKVCFKSAEGWGGHGFELVEIHRDDGKTWLLRARTGARMSVAEFCAEVLNSDSNASGLIMERFLVQHDVLSTLNPTSLNTLRIWVLQNGRASAECLLSYLRIGRAGAIVDNQSSGGIVVPVNMGSGTLRAAADGTPRRQTFAVHPDHGATIEGVQIPFFNEALQVAIDSVLAFPHIRFAGVDVAIAQDGPRIIELNVSPDRIGAAFVGQPIKHLLGA